MFFEEKVLTERLPYFLECGYSYKSAIYCIKMLICWHPDEFDRLLDFGCISKSEYDFIKSW